MAATKQIVLINAATITSSSASAATAVALPGHNKWAAYVVVAGAVAGSSPTLDITIQHSVDDTNWVTLIAMTQLTAAASETKFASSATDYLKPILPYVRASYTIGGTGGPSFAGVTLKLLLDN